MAPGPILGAFLSSIDLDALSGVNQLVVLRAQQRQLSHDQARLLATMASVVDAVADECEMDLDHAMGLADAADAAATEIRAALLLTRRAADRELEFALELRRRLPRVQAALASGLIDRRRAGILVWDTLHLAVAESRAVVEQVLDDAAALTTGQLRARIRRLCMAADPGEARRRYAAAVDSTDAGTANLTGMNLPADRVAEIRDRIEQIARSLRGSGETRSIDQLRADVYLDLLAGTVSDPKYDTGRRGVIDLQLDVETLVELADTPGELAGYGPVIADVARRVVAEHTGAEWRYTVTSPDSGAVIACGITGRRPVAGQRRAVQTRNPTCVFPGCRMPATHSDLDHRTPHARGGDTAVDNLAPLCRHDHCAKHAYGWTYRRLPNDDIEWTNPLGRATVVPAGGNRSP